MGLEDTTEGLLKEEQSAASDAIRSLITAKKSVRSEDSDTELKTDLTADEVKAHTIISTISKFVEMTPVNFNDHCILSELVNKKERKAWSKNRLSRREIVEVARQPEMNMDMQKDMQKEGFVRRMFTPKK